MVETSDRLSKLHSRPSGHSKALLILEYKASEYIVTDPCELPPFNIVPSPTPKPERLRLLGSPSFNWCDYAEHQFSLGPSSGFWIDPFSKEFNVIMFQLSEPYGDEEQDDVCGMYSSVLGDWKKIPIDEDLEFFYTEESTPAVVIGNVGHWTVYYDYTDDEGQEMIGVLVVSFDFKKEVFLESIGAFSIDKGWILPVLCNRDGGLSLVYMDPENSFDVFSRKEGQWILVHDLFIFPVLEKFMWRDEEEEDKVRKSRVLAAITGGGLLSFDSKDLILCTPLMIQLAKADEIVVANNFVASLLFPAVEC